MIPAANKAGGKSKSVLVSKARLRTFYFQIKETL